MAEEHIIGVIGGMGPEATVDLLTHIIRLTPAHEDNDHIRCVVDNNAKIPSRIKALYERTGPSAGPAICETGQRLEAYGADFLIMPCHTAHYYHADLQAAVSIPVLSILDITVQASRTRVPGLQRIGLLATTATVNTGLYADRFARAGIELMLPDEARQAQTLDLIKAIKAGQTGAAEQRRLSELAAYLAARGAQAVVLGCTELGLVAGRHQGVSLVDGLKELARAAVLRVKGRTTEGDTL